LIVLFCVERAGAQPAAAIPECLAHPACKLLNDQARQQSGAGQFDEALRSYRLAYEVTPDPRLLYSIGRVLHKQGHFAEAVPYYHQFLATPFTKPTDQAQKVPAQEFLRQCEADQPPTEPTKPPLVTTPDPPPPPVEAKRVPLYKRWWLWTIVGGTAAVALGVGLGVGLAAREPDLTDVTQYRPFAP
jgi:hypothetical protein